MSEEFNTPHLSLREDFKNIVISSSGSMISPFINFFAMPIILRIYSPAEYGLWVLLMSFAILPGNVSTFRFELAIVLAKTDEEAGRIVGLCLWLITGVALLSLVGAILSPLWFDRFPALEGGGGWLWIVPLWLALVGLSLVGRAQCTRLKAFTFNSASLMALAGVTNSVQIVGPALGISGSAGLIVGSIAGFAVCDLILFLGFWNRSTPAFKKGMWVVGYREIVLRYINLLRYSVPYTFISTLRIEGMKMLFGAFGNAALVGDFSFAQRLVNFPVTLFGGGIRPVLFQRAATVDSLPKVEPFIRNLLQVLIILGMPMGVVFVVKADAIFYLFAGEKWLNSVPYARVLVIPALILMVTGWLDRIFDVLGRQGLALVLEATFTILGLVLFSVGLLYLDNPWLAVLAQAVVSSVYYLITVLVIFKIAGIPLEKLALPGLLALGAGGITVLSYLLFSEKLGDWAGLGIGVLCTYIWSGAVIFRKYRSIKSD